MTTAYAPRESVTEEAEYPPRCIRSVMVRSPDYCSTQYDADFLNPLSALAFRHKSASYFMNSSRA